MSKSPMFMVRVLIVVVMGMISGCRGIVNKENETGERIDRIPAIEPDYAGIVIPPNIAPLNFVIKEQGTRFLVLMYGNSGDTLRMTSRGSPARILIPPGKWKKLLQANRGAALTIDILEKKDGPWRRYNSIVNRIAQEEIDRYLFYRRIFGFKSIPEMAIVQRDLEGFGVRTVLNNRTLSAKSLACINCHSFCPTDGSRMIVHMRGEQQGMLLVSGRKAVKIDTRTNFNKGPASYASWHPSGKIIAFAVMRVNQTLHSTGDPRVVIDEASDVILYDVEKNLIIAHPLTADQKRMETLPEWSPDGRYLYYCSAVQPENADAAFYSGLTFKEIKYDLMRVPFDITTRTFGEPEMLLAARENNMSNVHPRVSPDGRFLLFVTMQYSYFAVYDDSSELWLMDLSTKTSRPLNNVNSRFAESFHSWSSNGRWFVVSSRRGDGMCSCPYFAYVDSAGNVEKPFLLPQKDPLWYGTDLKSFNVPVLAKESVDISWRTLSQVAGDKKLERKARFDGKVRLDGTAGASEKR